MCYLFVSICEVRDTKKGFVDQICSCDCLSIGVKFSTTQFNSMSLVVANASIKLRETSLLSINVFKASFNLSLSCSIDH